MNNEMSDIEGWAKIIGEQKITPNARSEDQICDCNPPDCKHEPNCALYSADDIPPEDDNDTDRGR